MTDLECQHQPDAPAADMCDRCLINRLPRCQTTEMVRLFCGCTRHASGCTMTDSEAEFMSRRRNVPAHHDIPRRPVAGDYESSSWQYTTLDDGYPAIILCKHEHAADRWLCNDCTTELEQAVGDIPALVADLELAITKQTVFVQQGAPLEADPDEASLPFHVGASKALTRLRRLFDGDPVHNSRRMIDNWPGVIRHKDLQFIAGQITSAVRQAHTAIDRPPTLQYLGACPAEGCRLDLRAERGADRVICPCGYTIKVADHTDAALHKIDDMLMTETELVGAVTLADQPLRRTQIQSWVRSRRLEQRTIIKHVWRAGTIVTIEVKAYRLGDVQQLAAEGSRRKAS